MNYSTCYSLLQEPFKSVPVIWSIHERALATRLRQYMLNGQLELVNDWKKFFKRSTVVVFPNYALPVMLILHVTHFTHVMWGPNVCTKGNKSITSTAFLSVSKKKICKLLNFLKNLRDWMIISLEIWLGSSARNLPFFQIYANYLTWFWTKKFYY